MNFSIHMDTSIIYRNLNFIDRLILNDNDIRNYIESNDWRNVSLRIDQLINDYFLKNTGQTCIHKNKYCHSIDEKKGNILRFYLDKYIQDEDLSDLDRKILCIPFSTIYHDYSDLAMIIYGKVYASMYTIPAGSRDIERSNESNPIFIQELVHYLEKYVNVSEISLFHLEDNNYHELIHILEQYFDLSYDEQLRKAYGFGYREDTPIPPSPSPNFLIED